MDTCKSMLIEGLTQKLYKSRVRFIIQVETAGQKIYAVQPKFFFSLES